MRTPCHKAFSLVELSIVLVILGLLVGGILAGQSLIRASELRAISTEHARYFTAVQAFRNKYLSIPGDTATAVRLWGAATVDGDASGTILGDEGFRFWQHLQLAGLVEGSLSGTATSSQAVIGSNVPASKFPGAGWSANSNYNTAGDTNLYPIASPGTFFVFGTTDTTPVARFITSNWALKPVEAWNIDTKMDDGVVYSGQVIGKFWSGQCSNGTTLNYALATNAVYCSLFFLRQF